MDLRETSHSREEASGSPRAKGKRAKARTREEQGEGEGPARRGHKARRQMSDASIAQQLADAELNLGFTVDATKKGLQVFTQAFLETSTLGVLGCSVAWLIVHVEASELEFFTDTVRRTIFECCSAPQVGPRRGSIYPTPLEDLKGFERALQMVHLTQVQEPCFWERWQHQAWLFCALAGLNGMSGRSQPQALGPISKMQGRAVASLTQSVDRFLQLGGCHFGGVDRIRQELKGVRLSYMGEEMSSCHPLTRDQVLPALPPGNHGGSVVCLSLFPGGQPELLIVEDTGQELPLLAD